MTPPFSPPDVVLAALLLGSMWTDWREGKIRNVLTFPVMITGVLMAPLFAPHFYDGLLGLLAGFAISVPLWRFGGAFRPGDVKLVMAAGSLVGPEAVLRGVLLALALNLPVGLLVMALRGRLGHLYRFWVKGERKETTTMIFGIVISAGLFLARIQAWPNLWGPK
jgi:Flp pilus assembly protein protease CpaA